MRRAIRRGAAMGASFVAVALGIATTIAWRGLGHHAEGARRDRMRSSPQWHSNTFENPQPLVNDIVGGLFAISAASAASVPLQTVPVERVHRDHFASVPPSGLRVTWMGHSTALIEIDGARVLIDPIWSRRPSPLPSVGPSRWYAPMIALDSLLPVDVVVISHDHYDHLDMSTVVALARTNARFVVPLGLGAHLEYWGVRVDRITELDWWDSTRVGTLTVHSTPARHASGRMLIDNDATLWSGFALVGPTHRVYYSGDTGLFPAMREIGDRLGPFDCTLIEIGQYHRAWPDWHIGPEQAVEAHVLVRGRVLLPVHWGLFRLAYHGWTEPIERVTAAAALRNVSVTTPRPGESVEPTLPLRTTRWWPALPWETVAQHPIVSTQLR